ncbi:MAG: TonB-dependent receptor [Acidobacteria bacterium]|nr:TonB-dependent receptor [Acidobacteriota bacterium]MYJ04089.1 TonB-dependent receptor [Acidobacteriota bacterium]
MTRTESIDMPGALRALTGILTVGLLAAALPVEMAVAQAAAAQNQQQDPDEEEQPTFTETVVVVGTRAEPRSVTESPVPVDAIPATELVSQGLVTLQDQLRTVVPSFNVNMQPISDASTVVRPAMLRNLAPDHTLVLVNGKRRHRSSIIDWHGGNGVAFGSQGPDLSAIPAIALRQVEVLRDGAAAQYGSDAIAGVMNFLLKDAREGGSVEFTTGIYGEQWDGQTATFAGNVGLPLGQTGFANLSLEYGGSGATDRSIRRNDVETLVGTGVFNDINEPAQIWGSPDIDNDLKAFGNFGHLFANGTQFYAHTNYASKRVVGGFFFRNPNTRGGVFSADGGETLLIGDALAARGMGSANCPAVAVTGNVPDPAALDAIRANDNCFSFQERFPGGFTPNFGGDARDMSVVGGIRGFGANGLTWDASASFGAHQADLFIRNTVNASLGPQTPTEFDLGSNRQQDLAFNFDVSYPVSDQVNFAFGAEWRDEQYRTSQGQPESWQVGPYAAQGFSAGSNGFSGYSPLAAGEWSRNNVAVYGDLEATGTDDRWTLGGALRLERFEDFGATANGKVSARVAMGDYASLRGSVSTGFRAPTPGQQNGFNVSTTFDPVLMDLTERGTVPSIHPVAALRGGAPLDPERSRNYTVGIVADNGPFTLTVDYFRIDLDDRLAVTRDFSLTADEIDGLLAAGVENARGLASFRFFTNEISTTTQGVDIVSTYMPPGLNGNTVFSAVFNHTNTEVTKFDDGLLNVSRRIRELQEALPKNRWNFAINHSAGRVNVLGRVNYYGAWFDWDSAQTLFSGKPVVDVEVSIPLAGGTALAIGSQNVFNTFPDESPNARSVGERYSEYTPWGFNGAYYYARIRHSWGG